LNQVREYRRGNQKRTIQRNWQYRVHRTKKNKTKTIQRNWQHRVHRTKKNKQKQSRETDNIGYTERRKTKQKQSRETDNIGYTGRRKRKQKHNTICVAHHYTQANINNVNKTWALLRTTGDKDRTSFLCGNRYGHHSTTLRT
jgi:hypothetical protein